MRKVKIFENKRINNEKGGYLRHEKVEKGTGLFHQWGIDYEEFETGPGNYTVATVEMEDGTIDVFQPCMIQFIDPPKKNWFLNLIDKIFG